MRNRSKYVFGAAVTLGSVTGLIQQVDAASVTAAAFTFETSGTNFSNGITGASLGPYAAEVGVGSFSASHAATNTAYSVTQGNGSARSVNANHYATGDYYEFDVPVTTLQDIFVSFDSVASATGPQTFALQYSLDGTNFVNFTTYALDTGTATAFTTSASNTAVSYGFNLAAITGLNGDSKAAFRLAVADTGTLGGSGTAKVDNFVVSGNSIVSSPEPASVALAAFAAAGLLRRRRS